MWIWCGTKGTKFHLVQLGPGNGLEVGYSPEAISISLVLQFLSGVPSGNILSVRGSQETSGAHFVKSGAAEETGMANLRLLFGDKEVPSSPLSEIDGGLHTLRCLTAQLSCLLSL